MSSSADSFVNTRPGAFSPPSTGAQPGYGSTNHKQADAADAANNNRQMSLKEKKKMAESGKKASAAAAPMPPAREEPEGDESEESGDDMSPEEQAKAGGQWSRGKKMGNKKMGADIASAQTAATGTMLTVPFDIVHEHRGGLASLNANPKEAITVFDLTAGSNGLIQPGDRCIIHAVSIHEPEISTMARVGAVIGNLPGAQPQSLANGRHANHAHFDFKRVGHNHHGKSKKVYDKNNHANPNSTVRDEHYARYGHTTMNTAAEIIAHAGPANAQGTHEVFEGNLVYAALTKPSAKNPAILRYQEIGLEIKQAIDGERMGKTYMLVPTAVLKSNAAMLEKNVLKSEEFSKRRVDLSKIAIELVPRTASGKFESVELTKDAADIQSNEMTRPFEYRAKGTVLVEVLSKKQ